MVNTGIGIGIAYILKASIYRHNVVVMDTYYVDRT